MAVQMSVVYSGGLHCLLEHAPSGSQIETDAPKDNQGKGERFSPTDLMGAALGSCILTTMAIVAQRDGIELKGARADVEKVMITQPTRRIGSLRTKITMSAASVPAAARAKLENAAHHCPVHKSLHPEIDAAIEFHYE